MNLSVFHRHLLPNRNYVPKDKLNSLTGYLECRLLEWTGWYNQDIYQRLLGHYRLYQLFRKECIANTDLPCPLAYIVNYRASHNFKYLLSRIIGLLYYAGSLGKPYHASQTEEVNKILINEYAHILYAFLTEADDNFGKALTQAIQQIRSLNFSERQKVSVEQSTVIFQSKHETNNYHSNTHYFNEYTTVNPVAGTKGKQKGVFSKKQILILMDFLSDCGRIEKIDLTKPNKFDHIAGLLFAITGKGKDSWIEELKSYRQKGLYEFRTDGELSQLRSTITNMADILRSAGFRNVSNSAEKKLRELEEKR